MLGTLATLGAVAIASPVFGQVTLKPLVVPGAKVRATNEIHLKQVLSIAGMDLETGNDQTTVTVSENGQRAADGSITSRNKIESLKANMSLPGGVNLQFDSTNPEATGDAGPYAIIVDLLKAASASEWEAKLGKDGRIIEAKIVSNAGAGLSAEARKLYEGQVNPAALRDEVNEELDRLPKGPVKVGDKWEVTRKMRLEGGQSLSFQEEFEYRGEETVNGKKLHRVNVTAKSVSFAIDPSGGLPLSLKSSDLKVTESAGHFLFDVQRGMTVAAAGRAHIKGDLVFVSAGQELPGKLDLTIESRSSVE